MSNPIEVQEHYKEVAALKLAGMSDQQIVKSTGIGRYALNKIKKSPEYKAYYNQLTEEVMEDAKAILRHGVSKLAVSALEVIKMQLEEKGNLEAVKVVMKVMGLDQAEEGKKEDTTLNIILPTTRVEKEVPND